MKDPRRILQDVKGRLRDHPAVHPVWRLARRHQQERAFERTLAGLGEPRGDLAPPAPIGERLRQRARGRSPLPDRPRVLAFGTSRTWEQQGLWPSFERLSDFELFEYGDDGRSVPAMRADLRRGMLERADAFRPDLCFLYADSAYIDPTLLDELARRGAWTVILGLDDKHRFAARERDGARIGQVTLAPHTDVMWTTWHNGVRLFDQAGGVGWFAPEGADPAFHRPLEVERDLDVVLVGQRYGMRKTLVEYLRAQGFRVDAFGGGWPSGRVSFEATVELYSRARVVLGCGTVQHTEGVFHLKGRDFEVPMCGAVYLTTYCWELSLCYDIGRELLCYSSLPEAAEVLHAILRDDARAAAMRSAVLATCLERHTWERRIQDLFTLLRFQEPPPFVRGA